MYQNIIIAKGQQALENETKATEKRQAAKAAVEAYKQGKQIVEVLANPVVAYEYDGAEYTANIDATSILENKKGYTILCGKLADAVAADACRTLGNNAPRIDRNKALTIITNMAKMLGYTDYTADKRDFDYVVMGMTGHNADADIRIKAARKAVNNLFRIKLNGGNVRVMLQGNTEFNGDYLKAKADKEKEMEAQARERAEKKAAREKALAEKKAAIEVRDAAKAKEEAAA